MPAVPPQEGIHVPTGGSHPPSLRSHAWTSKLIKIKIYLALLDRERFPIKSGVEEHNDSRQLRSASGWLSIVYLARSRLKVCGGGGGYVFGIGLAPIEG